MASTASLPTPSHMKIDSTMAVPPRRLPMESIKSVMIVTRDERRTLKISVAAKGIPRARAANT